MGNHQDLEHSRDPRGKPIFSLHEKLAMLIKLNYHHLKLNSVQFFEQWNYQNLFGDHQ